MPFGACAHVEAMVIFKKGHMITMGMAVFFIALGSISARISSIGSNAAPRYDYQVVDQNKFNLSCKKGDQPDEVVLFYTDKTERQAEGPLDGAERAECEEIFSTLRVNFTNDTHSDLPVEKSSDCGENQTSGAEVQVATFWYAPVSYAKDYCSPGVYAVESSVRLSAIEGEKKTQTDVNYINGFSNMESFPMIFGLLVVGSSLACLSVGMCMASGAENAGSGLNGEGLEGLSGVELGVRGTAQISNWGGGKRWEKEEDQGNKGSGVWG